LFGTIYLSGDPTDCDGEYPNKCILQWWRYPQCHTYEPYTKWITKKNQSQECHCFRHEPRCQRSLSLCLIGKRNGCRQPGKCTTHQRLTGHMHGKNQLSTLGLYCFMQKLLKRVYALTNCENLL